VSGNVEMGCFLSDRWRYYVNRDEMVVEVGIRGFGGERQRCGEKLEVEESKEKRHCACGD